MNQASPVRPTRLLLLLNEEVPGSHSDVRRAVDALMGEGVLEAATIIPFLALLSLGHSSDEVNTATVDAARTLDATVILWSHAEGLPVSKEVIAHLRRLPSRPTLGHREGDAYCGWYKPLPATQWELFPQCDVLFFPARLRVLKQLRRVGCGDIRYVPSVTDEYRFGVDVAPRRSPEFDVVTIGNRVSSRVPFRTMPGARERVRLVRRFSREFGARFAVFGEGWSGASAHGGVPFEEQTRAYARGRVVLANANLNAPYSFSNRLPIAMSSGVPVVHSALRGSELLFGERPPLRFFRDEDHALATAKELLSLSQRELDAIGEIARGLALSRFSMRFALRYMVQALESVRSGVVNAPRNPWLPFEQL